MTALGSLIGQVSYVQFSQVWRTGASPSGLAQVLSVAFKFNLYSVPLVALVGLTRWTNGAPPCDGLLHK